jgi:23S rRNA pseudouridine2605 synthase
VRLAKYLARSGIGSRRTCEQIIAAGRVTVGGEIVTDPARDVDVDVDAGPGEAIALDGEPVRPLDTPVVYALNKPPGVVSTAHDPQGRPTVVSLVAPEQRLYPVGRLDIDTTGLILLTNDGELAYRLTHPRFEVDKSYRTLVANAPVPDAAIRALRRGVVLDDGPSSPARVRRLAPDTLEITIHEGRKRQVKRMCEAVGHPVRSLVRMRFGSLELGGLRVGEHRRLTETEVRALRDATAGTAGHRARAASS